MYMSLQKKIEFLENRKMRRINILHISDVHIQKKEVEEIREIIDKLIADIKKVQNEKKIKIDLICFTGDLIQCGDKAFEEEGQWNLAKEILVNPLLNELNLSEDRFISVPGNHEVDTSVIVPRLEKGLQIDSLQDINEVMDNFDESYIKRLAYYYEIVKKQLPNAIINTPGYSYQIQINGINVGIACVDSAWRSSGKGRNESGNLYVGARQIKKLMSDIKNCEIKICMMHHPIDWLESCEKLEIEKELSKFDLVLRGHVHEEDLKQIIRRNIKTIYSTAGKLYPLDYAEGRARDGFNGYSVISIDSEKSKCGIYLRTYYAQNRGEFDAGINICPNGEEFYDICVKDLKSQTEFDIVKGINQYFLNMSEKYTLIKQIDSQFPNDYSQTIVDPVLAYKSEYVKEDEKLDKDEAANIHDIMEANDNVLLIGKKESGKTTILQQIGLDYFKEYESRGILPIYINMKYLPKGSNRILNCAIQFIQGNIVDEASISKQQIKQIIDDGKIVFLIDNVKTSNADHTIWLTKFINEYNKNRFILTIEEEFFQSIDVKELPDYGSEFKQIYIQYMGKAQIRAMVTKWANGRDNITSIDETVDRIDSYCNQINFAKTPFNIAIFMVIWDNDHNFVPVNEGIVMENYLEIVLEKLSPKEGYRGTYSFKIKQNFLSHIAHEMYLRDKYYFTYEEFEEIVVNYHKKKGYDLMESQFDKIFFEKNILSYSGDYIVFSHTSFLEYFLAIYAFDNKEFLNEITSKGTRISFRNEICFYSGLNQDCTQLLDDLSDAILKIVVEHLDLVEDLNEMEIMTEFKIDKEKLEEDLQKNRPSQEELDIVSDMGKKYSDRKPTEISKKEVKADDAEDFFTLLQMYGSIIKNAELLDNKYKIEHLENYMYGMNILYAMIIKLFEYMNDKMKFEKLSEKDKNYLEVYTKEEFDQMKAEMMDVYKLLYPLAIQNLILENVGTPKLDAAINELIKNKQDKPFEKFMLTFLKCDLKVVNLKSILGKYIQQEKSQGILKIILMKLTFYYRARFFGNNVQIDKELIDLITDISVKMDSTLVNPRISKGKISQQIKLQLDNAR